MGDDGADSTVDEAEQRSDVISEGDGPAVDPDVVLAALAHPRRRHLLRKLADDGPEVSLWRLATVIAAAEREGASGGDDGVTDEHRQRVYVSLYHRHVPKLDDQGFVEYDDEADVVRAATVDAVRAVGEALGG